MSTPERDQGARASRPSRSDNTGGTPVNPGKTKTAALLLPLLLHRYRSSHALVEMPLEACEDLANLFGFAEVSDGIGDAVVVFET